MDQEDALFLRMALSGFCPQALMSQSPRCSHTLNGLLNLLEVPPLEWNSTHTCSKSNKLYSKSISLRWLDASIRTRLDHKVKTGMPGLHSALQPSKSHYPKMFSINLLYPHLCPHNHSWAQGKSAVIPEKTSPAEAEHLPPAEETSLLQGWSTVIKLCAAQLQGEPFEA